MYVPAWMKQDTDTYFRVRKVNGESINTISPFCEAAIEKDANAFAKVMAHIREIDEQKSTVIFVQVENEIGLLGTERDYSKEAEEKFKRWHRIFMFRMWQMSLMNMDMKVIHW